MSADSGAAPSGGGAQGESAPSGDLSAVVHHADGTTTKVESGSILSRILEIFKNA